MAEVLAEEYDVTLLTFGPIPWEKTNHYYGTALRRENFQLEVPSRVSRMVHALFPFTGSLLKLLFTTRHARAIAPRYDVVISASNEVDAGRRAIQYIHFPWGFWPRPNADLRWYHRLPGVLPAYYAIARAIAPVSAESIAANRTLVNSAWTGERFRETYGGTPTVLHPPISGTFRPRPWRERSDTFLSIGRIAPEKRIEDSIAVIEGVREATGLDLKLRIFGSFDNHEYRRRILDEAAWRPWITIQIDASRDELLTAAGTMRYGIHAMHDEHFGMAVAEMVRSGCLTFAHNSGGPKEILQHDSLLFDSIDDGIAKISAAGSSVPLRESLVQHLESRAVTFTRAQFREQLLAVVEEELALLSNATESAAT